MKKIFLILPMLWLNLAYISAQENTLYGSNVFMYMQPNARAEAMGRGTATTYGDPSSVMYNPASSSFTEGFDIEASHSNPYIYSDNKNYYDYFGASYSTNKYGTIAFTTAHYSFNRDNYYNYTPYSWLHTLNYSYVHNNFALGININYYKDHKDSSDYSAYYADLGLLKKIDIASDNSKQFLLIGVSLTNISRAELMEDTISYSIPSFFRSGISYEFQANENISELNLFKMLYSINYKYALNLDKTYSLQFGTEFTFLDILKLRAGYYWDKSSGNHTETRTDKHSAFTYGAGLSLPIGKLYDTKLPIELQFDYARLPIANEYDNYTYYANYSIYYNYRSYNIYSLNLKLGI
jgi:hypothetical protein